MNQSLSDKVAVTIESSEEVFKEKILHVLNVYPGISYTMLQVGIGNSIPAGVWRPILEELIKDGTVINNPVDVEHPSGRLYNYAKLYHVV